MRHERVSADNIRAIDMDTNLRRRGIFLGISIDDHLQELLKTS